MVEIRYRFVFSDGREEHVTVNPDADETEPPPGGSNPEWARLEFHQCPNCPLRPQASPACPLATKLVRLVELCQNVLSHDEVRLEVSMPERTVVQRTTAQRAVSSLMGLLVATSGCPHTEFLRPMARFHLPLASEEETIYRAVSTYLLGQYFRRAQGLPADFDLAGLKAAYHEIHTINMAMATRLRAVSRQDSAVNAMILLDLFAKALPYSIEESLEEIRCLFRFFLK